MGSTTRDQLRTLEDEGWRALCEGRGDRFYGDLMTPDGVMVLAHGLVLDREAVVSSLADAPPWRTYAISDERVIDLGPDAACLVYRATASRDPGEPSFTALMASTYVRRGRDWLLACYQQTPVPSPEDASG